MEAPCALPYCSSFVSVHTIAILVLPSRGVLFPGGLHPTTYHFSSLAQQSLFSNVCDVVLANAAAPLPSPVQTGSVLDVSVSRLKSPTADGGTWTPTAFVLPVANGGVKISRTPSFGVGERFAHVTVDVRYGHSTCPVILKNNLLTTNTNRCFEATY